MRWGRTTTCSYCCSHTGLSASGSVWDRDGVANEQEKRKKHTERLATDARLLAACEGKTWDLNWAAKNRRSELAAALRLFASRLSPTQSQTGPQQEQPLPLQDSTNLPYTRKLARSLLNTPLPKKASVESAASAQQDTKRRSTRLANKLKSDLTVEQQATALLMKKCGMMGPTCISSVYYDDFNPHTPEVLLELQIQRAIMLGMRVRQAVEGARVNSSRESPLDPLGQLYI